MLSQINNNRNRVGTALEAVSLKSRYQCSHGLSEGKDLFQASLPAPGVCQQPWAFLGWETYHSHLCLCHFMASLRIAHVSVFSSYKDTSHWIGAHPTPVWPYFNLINYICKGPTSKKGHMLRLWVDMISWRILGQPSTPTFESCGDTEDMGGPTTSTENESTQMTLSVCTGVDLGLGNRYPHIGFCIWSYGYKETEVGV